MPDALHRKVSEPELGLVVSRGMATDAERPLGGVHAPTGSATTLEGTPLMLTVSEAATVLRVSRPAAYKLAPEWEATRGQSGIPVVRFGTRILVRRADVALIVGVDPAA